ncbi:MAG: hypothetical protein CMJ46_02280 [Planctomyces sp.]|nr:hypothetical protein [Planctomyces sp.]
MSSPARKRVLFLCTGNSCRSQMAEGYLRELRGDKYESLSAGANPAGYVNEKAIEVMREVGIDISEQTSKSIREFLPPVGSPPDIIVAVCDTANQNCPVFPGDVQRISMPFDDPYYAEGSEDDVMNEFRRVRDEIRAAIEITF